jgi:predicted nuclease of restriction endonuclease-like (RecB) superfamily
MGNGMAAYAAFIKDIKELVYRRQFKAMKHVNSELIQLYWEIGEEIERQQHEKGWGKSVVEVLAKELQKEFPGVQGFSARNLWLMRSFYLEYSQGKFLHPSGTETQEPILHPSGAEFKPVTLPALLVEIGWKKNVIIMQKCKELSEREFYIKMTKRYGWTKDVLINNIENKAFEKYLTNQTNFDETVPEKYRLQAKLAIKDDYNFDFIEMGIEHSERELEAGLIKNIRTFLTEMGGDFCFIDTQYHLDAADDDYYIGSTP